MKKTPNTKSQLPRQSPLHVSTLLLSCALLVLSIYSCTSTKDAELKQEALRKYPADHPFSNSEFIRVDGVRVHFRQWEPSADNDKEPKGIVFLVHGVSGSTYNWQFLAPDLAKEGWSVLASDLPPFGFSGEKQETGIALDPLPPDSSSRAKLLWNLFDAIYGEYNGQVILIGHSLGGRIASLMTLSKPEKVSKLVLLAPAVYGSSAIPTITRYWPFNHVAIDNAKKGLENPGIVRFVMNKAYGKKADNDILTGNWAPFLREGVPQACADWAIKSIDSGAPSVQNIKVPTLILWGAHDSIVPNKGILLEKQMPNSQYVEIPGKSHCVMDTDHDIVDPLIVDFIN